jgi:D-serine dehydratase
MSLQETQTPAGAPSRGPQRGLPRWGGSARSVRDGVGAGPVARFVRDGMGAEIVDLSGKGIGAAPEDTPLAHIAQLGWNLLHEDISLPVAVLSRDALDHNLRWMQRFIEAYRVDLAPHGKTTMCPALFEQQLRAGAWGITLATASQARAAYRHGVRRILMANQLVGKQNMAIVSDLLRDPRLEFFCLVDSPEGVDQLGRFFSERRQRIEVLLELGENGGRTGVRDERSEAAVLAALARWRDTISLAGVEVYEGVLPNEPAIREFLQRAVATVARLAAEGHFASVGTPGTRDRVILTGAGSSWFDVVAEEFSRADVATSVPLQIVLRPGCYLTHDIGAYRDAQLRMTSANVVVQQLGDGLRPALHVWAYIHSRPEPELTIVGLGKRDAAFDAGLPVPALHYRPAAATAAGPTTATMPPASLPTRAPANWTLTRIMDQHAYMKVPANADLRVGDMVAFDISHPCLTWDKWRQVALIDRDYRVVELMQTYF